MENVVERRIGENHFQGIEHPLTGQSLCSCRRCCRYLIQDNDGRFGVGHGECRLLVPLGPLKQLVQIRLEDDAGALMNSLTRLGWVLGTSLRYSSKQPDATSGRNLSV